MVVNQSVKNKAQRRRKRLMTGLVLLVGLAAIGYWLSQRDSASSLLQVPQLTKPEPKGGKIVRIESTQVIPAASVKALSAQNFGPAAPEPKGDIVKAVIVYTSELPDGTVVNQYARAYVPQSGTKLPALSFAPGTTGIGDQCAGSLEQPQIANWANYESHMATYAGQGVASIITDYEGMRDPSRLHHYMVGELEGRAVIDSLRALKSWNTVKERLDEDGQFVGGFSQGGHSAMWADKIAADYAPELSIKGVVGFGPVSDVTRTWADITRGATLSWFGAMVLTSYQDYYGRDYNTPSILLPNRLQNFERDAQSRCIDSFIQYYGRNPAGMYKPEFIQALASDSLASSGYTQLSSDLAKNAVGDQKTDSAKLINQGQQDNVILTGQQDAFMPKLCQASKGPAKLTVYPQANHYNIMVQGFSDTVSWIRTLQSGGQAPSSCQN